MCRGLLGSRRLAIAADGGEQLGGIAEEGSEPGNSGGDERGDDEFHV